METHPAPNREVTYAVPELNPVDRLRELIVYIARRSAYDRAFGVTKLNKLLWWSDIWSFGIRGRPITGVAYKRLPQGPVPDGVDQLREHMQAVRDIAISKEEAYGRTRHRIIALRRPDLAMFSGEEIAIVDGIIDDHRDHTATGVSSRSHGRMWEALPHLHEMPYETVFVSDRKPTRYDVARTKELNRQFGWE